MLRRRSTYDGSVHVKGEKNNHSREVLRITLETGLDLARLTARPSLR